MNLNTPQLLSKQLRTTLAKVGHHLLSPDILIRKLALWNTRRTRYLDYKLTTLKYSCSKLGNTRKSNVSVYQKVSKGHSVTISKQQEVQVDHVEEKTLSRNHN